LNYTSHNYNTNPNVTRLNKEAKDLAHHGGLGDSFSDFASDVAGGDLTTKVKNAVKFLPGGLSALSGLIPGGETGTDRVNKSLAETKKHLAELKYEAGQAFSDGASSAEKFADAMGAVSAKTIAARTAAHNTAVQFVGLGDSLNDSKVSLDGWIDEMAASARALTEFGNNARKAADKGLRAGLIKALQEAGPEGALRMAQLADATDAEIRKANRAWSAGRRAVKNYTDTVGGVPTKVVSEFILEGLTPAEKAIVRIRNELLSIPRRISTRYYVTQVNSLNKQGQNLPGHGSAAGNIFHYAAGDVANRHMPELAGPGLTRVWREPETGGEAYIPLANDWRRPRAKSIAAETVALLGGTAFFATGAVRPPQIGTAAHSGGLPMIGTAASATFGLAQAIRELQHFLDSHDKLNKAERRRLEKKLDQLQGLQQALKDFSVKDLLPTKDPTNPIWAGVRSELADLQKAVKAAGGRWSGAMQDDAHSLLAHALKLDQLNRQSEKLKDTVEAQQQAYDDLKQKMADFGDQVASNFRTDLFGGETPASAQSILDVLTSDTNRASQFYDAFNTLSSRGLDTSILQELGSKGDLASAQNLAQNATAAQIAQINAAFGGRSQMLDLLGKSAGNDVYRKALSEQNVTLQASLAAQQANVAAVNAQTTALVAEVRDLKNDVRDLGGRLEQAIRRQPDRATTNKRK
jgi:hypothetical protein